MNDVDFTFEGQSSPDESGVLKIQTDQWELNVWLTADDVGRLKELPTASWDERRSIRAGVAAAAPVSWASDGELVTIMVGHDDETWDFAVSFVGLTRLLGALALS